MATEYVDAGTAIPYAALSMSAGKAPPVAKGVNFERILNARDEPHNWLTYYGAYDANRYSPLDQINASNVGKLKPEWVFQAGQSGLAVGRNDVRLRGFPAGRRRGHVRLRMGRPVSGLSTRRPGPSYGATGTPPRSTCRCAAATSTAGSPSPRGRSS